MPDKKNYEAILKTVASYQSQLVAVSKTKSENEIREVLSWGQNDFGENYAQELAAKQQALPHSLRWHFIGHLQSNKIKFIAPFVHLVQTVDSLSLLQAVNRQAAKCNRVISCLLQVHIADEETKTGLGYEEARKLIAEVHANPPTHIEINGLMGMATLTDDVSKIRKEFSGLYRFFSEMQKVQPSLHVLSMGMTSDYRIALDEGSTMVRIGSAIFGER